MEVKDLFAHVTENASIKDASIALDGVPPPPLPAPWDEASPTTPPAPIGALEASGGGTTSVD